MLTTGFSIRGASLKLLRIGERGVITRINPLQDRSAQNLREIGLTPGQIITVEQRFPRFIVRIGNHQHSLDPISINAVYVRLLKP
jgi:Fe2+ transport system protein FeoA